MLKLPKHSGYRPHHRPHQVQVAKAGLERVLHPRLPNPVTAVPATARAVQEARQGRLPAPAAQAAAAREAVLRGRLRALADRVLAGVRAIQAVVVVAVQVVEVVEVIDLSKGVAIAIYKGEYTAYSPFNCNSGRESR
jgi:hypothetical protein